MLDKNGVPVQVGKRATVLARWASSHGNVGIVRAVGPWPKGRAMRARVSSDPDPCERLEQKSPAPPVNGEWSTWLKPRELRILSE